MLTWIGNDQSMQMRETSRAVDKKLLVNNNVGRALKFYSSVRLDVRRTETVKEAGEAVSNKVKIKVVKNKVAPPFKETTVTIKFGKGLDKLSEVFDLSVENGAIIKSGSWFSLANGERIGQGAENAKKYIEEHPDLFAELCDKAVASMGEPAEALDLDIDLDDELNDDFDN